MGGPAAIDMGEYSNADALPKNDDNSVGNIKEVVETALSNSPAFKGCNVEVKGHEVDENGNVLVNCVASQPPQATEVDVAIDMNEYSNTDSGNKPEPVKDETDETAVLQFRVLKGLKPEKDSTGSRLDWGEWFDCTGMKQVLSSIMPNGPAPGWSDAEWACRFHSAYRDEDWYVVPAFVTGAPVEPKGFIGLSSAYDIGQFRSKNPLSIPKEIVAWDQEAHKFVTTGRTIPVLTPQEPLTRELFIVGEPEAKKEEA